MRAWLVLCCWPPAQLVRRMSATRIRASFWTHFYFTGWGKHDLHRTIWGDVKLLVETTRRYGDWGNSTGQVL